MTPQTALRECAGWFGKLPSLGDFATRKLPRSFVEPWDEWLSAQLSEAQVALPETWEDLYQRAVPLCFLLGAGVLDDYSWHGVVVASFDRVGRRFPLTIALSSGQHAVAVRTREWWAALVAMGRRAVEHGDRADVLDAALTDFVSWHAEDVLRHDRAAQVADPACVVAEGGSAWWPWRGDERVGQLPSIFRGLPRGESFRALLTTL